MGGRMKPLIKVEIKDKHIVLTILDGPSCTVTYLTDEETKNLINKLVAARLDSKWRY